MVKLSDGVEWGIHCAAVLAGIPEGTVLSGKALAEFHGVSESYLLKHLKAMVKGGILESIPGPTGGFRLARPASDVTFLELVEAIEGPMRAFRCTEIRKRCPILAPNGSFASPCAINARMRQAERVYRDALKGQTLADLGEELERTLSPERRQSSAEWLAPRLRRPASLQRSLASASEGEES